MATPTGIAIQRGSVFVFKGPLHTRPGFAGPPSEGTEGFGCVFFFLFIVDFYELIVYNGVIKNQPWRNIK